MTFNKISFILVAAMLVLAACGDSSPAEVVELEPAQEQAEQAATTSEPTATPIPALPTAPGEAATTEVIEIIDPTEEPSQEATTEATEPAELDIPAGNPDLEYAQVEFVTATQSEDGTWRFDTTVRHNDQGWENYADAWQVVNPFTDEVIAERVLLHPHDNEQPFTRSESGIVIPKGLDQVLVRAKDNVEGFGGETVLVDLTVSEGDNFEVVRE